MQDGGLKCIWVNRVNARVVGSFHSRRCHVVSGARRLPTSTHERRAMVSRGAETLQQLVTHYAHLHDVLSNEDEDEDDEDVPSQMMLTSTPSARMQERLSRGRGRASVNERATRAGMASGVQASEASTRTARTSKTIHPLLRDEFDEGFRISHELFCDFEDKMTTVGLFQTRTKSKSVPPRLLLLASFERLASGAHWSTI